MVTALSFTATTLGAFPASSSYCNSTVTFSIVPVKENDNL